MNKRNKLKTISLFLILLSLVTTIYAQGNPPQAELRFFTDILGTKGLLIAVGILFFFISYKNNVRLFDWIDRQTTGTRDYILDKADILMIKLDPQKVTYSLLGYTFGPPLLILAIFLILGQAILGVFFCLVFFVLTWKSPRYIVDYLVERRINHYHGQMVDGLNLLANGVRAGLSVPQAIGMVVDELEGPISEEFSIILQQNRIGVPLEEALENLNKRIPLEDNEMFVTSINILRETGGNLAEVFDTIVHVIRARVKLQQKINVFTAQGRMQARIILSMPTALLLYFLSSNENTVEAVKHPIGIAFLIGVYVLNIIAGFVLMKVIQIKV